LKDETLLTAAGLSVYMTLEIFVEVTEGISILKQASLPKDDFGWIGLAQL
jgi:hypothetical protein